MVKMSVIEKHLYKDPAHKPGKTLRCRFMAAMNRTLFWFMAESEVLPIRLRSNNAIKLYASRRFLLRQALNSFSPCLSLNSVLFAARLAVIQMLRNKSALGLISARLNIHSSIHARATCALNLPYTQRNIYRSLCFLERIRKTSF